MKNDLTDFLYTPILRDISKILDTLEYQPTCSDGFPTFRSFTRIKLIEETLYKLVDELGVSDNLLDSFKVTKALQDPTTVPNFPKCSVRNKNTNFINCYYYVNRKTQSDKGSR